VIVHVNGPGGSGKTIAAMRMMARFDRHENMHVASVSNPDGVGVYCKKDGLKSLAMIGRYGSTCGGLDTLRRNFVLAQDLAEYLHDEGYNVLSEGFITEKQTHWLESLAESRPVALLCMRITLEEAVMGVAARRAKRIGDLKEGSRSYCDYQIRSCERTMKKLEGSKLLTMEWVTRSTVEKRLLELLEIT
jgi:hypothetical protein